MKYDLKKYGWIGLYVLVIAGGLAHIWPSSLASIVSMSIFGISLQMIAGVAILGIGFMGLGKVIKG